MSSPLKEVEENLNFTITQKVQRNSSHLHRFNCERILTILNERCYTVDKDNGAYNENKDFSENNVVYLSVQNLFDSTEHLS